jgi:hypothetical protein
MVTGPKRRTAELIKSIKRWTSQGWALVQGQRNRTTGSLRWHRAADRRQPPGRATRGPHSAGRSGRRGTGTATPVLGRRASHSHRWPGFVAGLAARKVVAKVSHLEAWQNWLSFRQEGRTFQKAELGPAYYAQGIAAQLNANRHAPPGLQTIPAQMKGIAIIGSTLEARVKSV